MVVTVPPIWKEKRAAVIIGGGPSLAYTNLKRIEDSKLPVIGCNNAFKLGDWVTVCWWGDMKWINFWGKKPIFVDYRSKHQIWSCNESSAVRNIQKKILFVRRGKPRGIETNPRLISWNGNTGFSAINMAYHFGVKKIILVGFDMKRSESTGEKNWHEDHKKIETPAMQKANRYPIFMKAVQPIARDARRLGLTIINSTVDTAIPEEFFPRMRLKEAINHDK